MTVRTSLLLLTALSLTACDLAPYDPSVRAEADQRRLAGFIGDRTAGPPTRCIPSYPGMQVQAVGDQVVAKWGGRVWVNQVQGSCRMADSSTAYLVTEPDPAGQYCQNTTFKVVSTTGGMIMGSCMLGPWVPYSN